MMMRLTVDSRRPNRWLLDLDLSLDFQILSLNIRLEIMMMVVVVVVASHGALLVVVLLLLQKDLVVEELELRWV